MATIKPNRRRKCSSNPPMVNPRASDFRIPVDCLVRQADDFSKPIRSHPNPSEASHRDLIPEDPGDPMSGAAVFGCPRLHVPGFHVPRFQPSPWIPHRLSRLHGPDCTGARRADSKRSRLQGQLAPRANGPQRQQAPRAARLHSFYNSGFSDGRLAAALAREALSRCRLAVPIVQRRPSTAPSL
jgi:hypothetical protein